MRSDCPNDEELGRILDGSIPPDRREVLRRHIATCADCRAVIVEVLKHDLAHESTDVARPALRAGRYLLGRVLGMGGMGVVYEAEDPQLGRLLAVKVMRTQRGDSVSRDTTRDDAKVERHRQRFVREGQSLARVVHPNVVSVYDVGQVDDQIDGQVFVAMELVEGGTLRDWMQQGGHSFAQALDMFLAVGRGLLAVHEAGLVHRDFKPENVLLGKDGRPKVTDFGLARQTEDSQPELAPDVVALWQGALTQTGALLGTPAYMPLEQLRGQVAGPAADVFAFAVTIWEALYGARPFTGATVDEIESAIRRGRTQPTTACVPNLPTRVRRVLRRALALRAADRPSLGALLVQLEALRRPPAWRTPLALGASAVLVTVAVLGTLWGLRRADELACRQPIYTAAFTPDRRARAFEGLRRLGPDAVPVSQSLAQYAEALDDRRRAACGQARLDRTLDAPRFAAQVACLDRIWDRFDRTLLALGEGPPAPTIGPALARLPVPARCVDASRAPAPEEEAAARRLAEAATRILFGKPTEALELARQVGDASSLARHAALLAQAQAIEGEALLDLGQPTPGQQRLETAIQTALYAADYETVASASLAILERAARLQLPPRRRYELAQQLHWASVRGRLGDPFRAYSHGVVAAAHAAGGASLDAEIELRAGLQLAPDDLVRRRLQEALDRLLTGHHE